MDTARLSGERKAALALASLGVEDRAWMLERLPEPPRARVAALLDELREMRVPFDRELAKQLAPEPVKEQPAKEQRSLDSADVLAVLTALEREPDWLVALVLRARPWPWRAAFLQGIGSERELNIKRALPVAVAVRPKFLAALLAALEEKLREQPREQWEAAGRSKPFWRGGLPWRR
jgi:hypothetical protein